MAETKMATRKSVEALAKKLHGKNAFTEYRPNVPDAAEKERLRERFKTLRERKHQIEQERKSLGSHWKTLLAAAQFVCDVDGDNPSIDELRKCVAISQRDCELQEEYFAVSEEMRKIRTFDFRCSVLVNRQFYNEHIAGGDTWDEVAEKLRAKAD